MEGKRDGCIIQGTAAEAVECKRIVPQNFFLGQVETAFSVGYTDFPLGSTPPHSFMTK